MSYNPASTILGPAYVFTRNKAFYSKGNIAVLPKLDTFDVELAAVGRIEDRELSLTYEISFTPVGRLDALSVLWPYGIINPGELVHAVAEISSVATGTEIITFTSLARFRDGAPVRLKTFGSLPGGLSASTLYYLHKLSSTTGTLHTSEANALAATSPVNLTSSGTGLTRMIEQEYLKIIDALGTQHLFHNTAVVDSPDIEASAGQTAIGAVKFEAFRQFDLPATNAASLYTKSTGVTLDTSFSPADIITESYTLGWGSTAPWDAIATRAGVKCTFPLSLSAEGDDTMGTVTRRLDAATAQFSCQAIGLSEDDLHAKLIVQNTGAGRGRRLTSTDHLNLISTTSASLYARLYGAVLSPAPINWDRKLDRLGELTWTPTRQFVSGVAQPLYYVGASAPV